MTEEPEPTIEVVYGPGGDPCEQVPHLCGNSPGYLHGGMHEMSLLPHVHNTQGLRFSSDTSGRIEFFMGSVAGWAEIVDGQIIAHLGKTTLLGANTMNGRFHVLNSLDERIFDLAVMGYTLDYYRTGDPTPLHRYVLQWGNVDGGLNGNACNPYVWPLRSDPLAFFPMLDGEVIMYAGDRFVPSDFTVKKNPSDANGWITFGCAGQVLAKIDLANQTRHRQLPHGYDDWAGRQATLKMYVADYCGPDLHDPLPPNVTRAHTVAGTPLLWKSPSMGYALSPLPAASDLEARWDENGAKCIHRARLEAHPSDVFPGFTASSLWAVCPTHSQPCGDNDPTHLVGALRVSANYFP